MERETESALPLEAHSGQPDDAGSAAQAQDPSLKSRPTIRRLGFVRRIKAYGEHHLQAVLQSLGRMARAPVASLMTVAVIGIALALPAGLHAILKNVQEVSAGWENAAQISLFLRKNLGADRIQRLVAEIKSMKEVAVVDYISPTAALAEFQSKSGFGDALDALRQNPLPAVLVVQPSFDASAPAMVEQLLMRLRAHPDVEIAQLDIQWIKRLYAMIAVGKRGITILGGLLALAVLLIVGNTIRLAIQNRRDEIEVQKLIGATDAFIRRPFLYSGCWHGLLGAMFAWLVVTVSLWMLKGPVESLSALYDSRFELDGLGLQASLFLLLFGISLGFIGAWLAVDRHLRGIEPT